MYLLNENYQPITDLNSGIEPISSKYYWEYDFVENDFFLTTSLAWYDIITPSYILQIGKNRVELPEDYYFIIADVSVGFDSIQPVEILGRDFDAFTFRKNIKMDSWELQTVTEVGYNEESRLVYPRTKNPVVIAVGDRHAMLVSETNLYNKVKDKGFSDII